jgi:hypothetical protein
LLLALVTIAALIGLDAECNGAQTDAVVVSPGPPE